MNHTPEPAAVAPVTVLLIDDHELIRAGLVGAFARAESLRVVAQAGTVADALTAFEETRPDVVISDLQLPDGTGLDVVRRVRASAPDTGIVILTMHAGDDQILAAMEAGASGFVGKDAPAAEVVRTAAHAARSPHTFICAGLAQVMVRRMSGTSTRMSEREQQILVLLADGLAAQQIGRRLHISESTAKSHIARIYSKLGAANRAQAVVTAMRIGLLSSLDPGLDPLLPLSTRDLRPQSGLVSALCPFTRRGEGVWGDEHGVIAGTPADLPAEGSTMIQYLSILLGAQKSKADQRGASAVEYGLLVALIAVAIIAAVFFLGEQLTGIFTEAGETIEDRAPAGGGQ